MNITMKSAFHKACRLAVATTLWCAASWAQAQNMIEAVTGGVQGGVEIIRVDLAQPLAAAPAGFTIQSPARIALDFPGVGNAMGRSTVELNQGNLRSANVVQAGDRTRLVLNLKQAAGYKTQLQGKSLLIILDQVAVANAAPVTQSAPVFAESRNRDTVPLKDIDFRRGTDGSGRVVVDLNSNQVGVDIRQQGQTLVVEFLRTSLPEGLRRKLDVCADSTPAHGCSSGVFLASVARSMPPLSSCSTSCKRFSSR